MEIAGTAIIVFLSCMGSCFGIQGDQVFSMHTSLTAGLAVATAIQTFGHLSGAHVNPAVTLNALIVQEIKWQFLFSYIGAQVVGSLIGAGIFAAVTNDASLGIQADGNGVCVTAVNNDITVLQGLAVEVLLSAILNLAICASWDARNSDKIDSVSLKIGLLVAVLNLGGGAYTGASMNPCRSFGPAVLSADWNNHWIYWTGPIVGALIASGLYRFMFWENKKM
ncbi:aquaporin-4-like isoform X2 [Dendroctonus ponderosae]|uniref:aquaporin-4-like isoform X2 n=1 Tax=Dendroctonus ponderosae TaxID=77166 RepID=UPI0020360A62|nr:aquaporin-4-like isoform X2 [Dendroctonus ponderosae]